MRTIIIEKEKLEIEIENALRQMHNFEWSGWGIAIHAHYDGTITSSDIISQNTFSVSDDFEEICRIYRWSDDEHESIAAWFYDLKNAGDEYTPKVEKVKSLLISIDCDIDTLEYSDLDDELKEDYDEYIQQIEDDYVSESVAYRIAEIQRNQECNENYQLELI
jgi:hypothetical protein